MKYDTKQNILRFAFTFALSAVVASVATIIANIITKEETEPKTEATAPVQKPTVARDTLRIVGVRPGYRSRSLLVTLTDRYGRLSTQECSLYVNCSLDNIDPLVTSFERGDTVVMEDGKITENLTQQRLIDEFTRQK